MSVVKVSIGVYRNTKPVFPNAIIVKGPKKNIESRGYLDTLEIVFLQKNFNLHFSLNNNVHPGPGFKNLLSSKINLPNISSEFSLLSINFRLLSSPKGLTYREREKALTL